MGNINSFSMFHSATEYFNIIPVVYKNYNNNKN